jgi:hypothetical protein
VPYYTQEGKRYDATFAKPLSFGKERPLGSKKTQGFETGRGSGFDTERRETLL